MNPFATLGLAPRFDVDLKALEKTHRDLARALHPDRHADAAPLHRKEALSRAVEVNEAYRIVKDPVRRAEALFTLAGVPTGETHEPKPSPALLMDVMELRESLAEARAARDATKVARLAADVNARAKEVEAELAVAFARALGGEAGGAPAADTKLARKDFEPLVPKLGELRFYRRFLEEVRAIEEHLVELSHAAPRKER